jgi:hypothetical protein
MSQPASQEVDKLRRELEIVKAELERARQREHQQRQRQVLTLPPPIDPNPIPKSKRDLLNPSQPAKTKRTKAIQYKGLQKTTNTRPVRRSSPPRNSLPPRTPIVIKSSPPRNSLPPRTPIVIKSSPPRKSPPRKSSPSRKSSPIRPIVIESSPKRSQSPPKPLKSSLKRSQSPKQFVLRPVDFQNEQDLNTPPITVVTEITIGRTNVKALKKDPNFPLKLENIPREAFKVTIENNELLVTALRDTPKIEYYTVNDKTWFVLAKDSSVYLTAGDKISIQDVLKFKIAR